MGDDFDRKFSLNQTNLEIAANAKAHEKENRRLRDADIATKFVQRNKIRFKTWLRTARKHIRDTEGQEKFGAFKYNRKLKRKLPGYFHSWYSKTAGGVNQAAKKVKGMKELRTKSDIVQYARMLSNAAAIRQAKADNRIREIADQVYQESQRSYASTTNGKSRRRRRIFSPSRY